MEAHLAAHGRHAEAVAIAPDPFDHAMHEALGLGMRDFAEGQRVHCRDGPRAHGEDVTQDAAHAGCRALIGFDVGRVVVAFHLEDDALAVADVDDARVLAGAADDLRAFGGQGAQPFLRRLVGAMLVPHGREDAEFGKIRIAIQNAQNVRVFVRFDPVRCDDLFGDLRLGGHARVPFKAIACLIREGAGGGKGGSGLRRTKKDRARGPA